MLTDHIAQEAEHCTDKEEHETVTDISEHDTKEERESYYSKYTWIDFLISRYAICINDLLEHPCNLIHSEQRRWFDSVVVNLLQCGNSICLVRSLKVLNLTDDLLLVQGGNPAEADIELIFFFKFIQS